MLEQQVKQQIDGLLSTHPVVLFMKGTADFPQCGFSAKAVAILRDCGVEFHTVNVLDDMQIREGIKLYSEWPTIPQLYIRQEFVGGSDIIGEMHAKGQLQSMLSAEASS